VIDGNFMSVNIRVIATILLDTIVTVDHIKNNTHN